MGISPRRYTEIGLFQLAPLQLGRGRQRGQYTQGRGLHSSTIRLNVSTFCGIRRVHEFPPVYWTGRQEEV